MRIIGKFLMRIGVNLGALYLLAYLLSGFKISSDLVEIIGAAVVLALIHWLVKPVVKLISFPLILLTFGLFNVVINYALLFAAEYFTDAVAITDFKTRLVASIIIGIFNSII